MAINIDDMLYDPHCRYYWKVTALTLDYAQLAAVDFRGNQIPCSFDPLYRTRLPGGQTYFALRRINYIEYAYTLLEKDQSLSSIIVGL